MNDLKKGKLFIENFLVYGFGQIIAKIVPLIMLPIVTRLMTDSYYMGINDIMTVAVSFVSQICILGMYDAMFRMFFDREDLEYRKSICSNALISVLIVSIIIAFILVILKQSFSKLFFSESGLELLIVVCAIDVLTVSLKSIVSAPTRMQNKKKVFLIINTLAPLIGYSVSIPMLINGEYLLALPLGSMISSIITFIIFTILNFKWFEFKLYDQKIVKELLIIGIPLMPTFVIYWIFSSFDRVMISKMLGNSSVGIYAIGSKLASVSQLIYAAFSGGWSYFAFSTMKEENQVDTISKVFEYLALISFTSFILISPFSKYIFDIIFTGDYVKGYETFPYLFLSPLILMLFQTISSQFLVIKKSFYVTLTLILGAILNILLNYILIPIYNIKGAAISTLIGYFVSLVIAYILLYKKKLIIYNKNIIINFIFIFVDLVFLFLNVNIVYCLILVLIYLGLNLKFYKKDIIFIINSLLLYLKKKRSNI